MQFIHDPLPMRFLTEEAAKKYISQCEKFGMGIDPYREGAVFPYAKSRKGL